MIFLSTFRCDPLGRHVPLDISRRKVLPSFDQTPCATQSRISSSAAISEASPFRLCVTDISFAPMSRDIRSKRLRTFCRASARRPSAVESRRSENVRPFISCSIHEKIVTRRPISRSRSAGSLWTRREPGTDGNVTMKTPNNQGERRAP